MLISSLAVGAKRGSTGSSDLSAQVETRFAAEDHDQFGEVDGLPMVRAKMIRSL